LGRWLTDNLLAKLSKATNIVLSDRESRHLKNEGDRAVCRWITKEAVNLILAPDHHTCAARIHSKNGKSNNLETSGQLKKLRPGRRCRHRPWHGKETDRFAIHLDSNRSLKEMNGNNQPLITRRVGDGAVNSS
jgi:hypothetical protein